MNSIYNISINKLDGTALDFAAFQGKKILIINVASACGYTPQYAQMQELQEAFDDKLVVIGVPCNDFGAQEPGTTEEIKQFCQINYGVTFPITEKVQILNHPHQLYDFLLNESKNGIADNEVAWNFHKFLLDEKGCLIESFPSAVTPIDDAITNHL